MWDHAQASLMAQTIRYKGTINGVYQLHGSIDEILIQMFTVAHLVMKFLLFTEAVRSFTVFTGAFQVRYLLQDLLFS
jgi:hypothetical protein